MEGGASGGGGGPAPFLLKTFEMIDDASTNDIVSWSSTNNSFVVWNPPDFAARLLPKYFKHNNFSSFIRQLNTYGFRKIDPERWEFANEDFVKGQKHLLNNIYRRKPIHSHSHPRGGCHADAERMALEDDIERLNKEKSSLEVNLLKFKQQQSGTGIQLEVLERRLLDMEQRQLKMIAFVHQAMQNPRLLESLVKMAAAAALSIDASVINKKRRLPYDVDHGQEVSGNNLCDDHSSTNKPEIGSILDQDLCDKLRLGLCSALPDDGLVTIVTQSSNEDNCISQIKQTDSYQGRIECLPVVPEILEPCETGVSICQSKNDLLARAVDGNTMFPCQLSLTLASSAMEIDCGKNYIGTSDLLDQGTDTNNCMIANAWTLRVCDTERGNDLNIPVRSIQNVSINPVETKAVSTQEAGSICNETTAIPSGGVNDVFWQQFLTERPGSIEVEEANSSLGANVFAYQNKEKVPRNENKGVSEENVDDLKL